MIGFIIIRHVHSEITNLYWQESYSCIRKFYPKNPIVIIDDNSESRFVTTIQMEGVTLIQSEFPKRAELLPYYYFLKFAWFDTAVILHDSVFIQNPIKFTDQTKFIWHFETHYWDNVTEETNLIKKLENNSALLELYNSNDKWLGCFGVMSVIQWEVLNKINYKYNYFKLLNHVTCRKERMLIERIFAIIVWLEVGLKKESCSYFGNIETYCKWGFNESYTFLNYKRDKQANNLNIPIVKLWSGR